MGKSRAGASPDEQRLLLGFLHSYVPLDREGKTVLKERTRRSSAEEILLRHNPWYQDALRLGREEGRRLGREEGRHEALVASTPRFVLEGIEDKFGEAAADLRPLIAAVTDVELLERIHAVRRSAATFAEFEAAIREMVVPVG